MAATTWENKVTLFRVKIEFYLGVMFVEELSTQDVLLRQELISAMRKKDDSNYAPPYLRIINNQLDAIMNYAINFYRLVHNLMKGVRKIRKKRAMEMN